MTLFTCTPVKTFESKQQYSQNCDTFFMFSLGITIHFPYFNGHSYVEYASIPFNNIINTIVLTFRTTSSSGLLLYAGHQTFRDFILLRIVNGLVEFRFNAGAETISIIAAEKVDTGMPMMIVAT